MHLTLKPGWRRFFCGKDIQPADRSDQRGPEPRCILNPITLPMVTTSGRSHSCFGCGLLWANCPGLFASKTRPSLAGPRGGTRRFAGIGPVVVIPGSDGF